MALKRAWEFHKAVFPMKSSFEVEKETFFQDSPNQKLKTAITSTKKQPTIFDKRQREYIVDPGASMLMAGRKDFTKQERAIVKDCEALSTQTAHGIVKVVQEANVYAHDRKLWVWVEFLQVHLQFFL